MNRKEDNSKFVSRRFLDSLDLTWEEELSLEYTEGINTIKKIKEWFGILYAQQQIEIMMPVIGMAITGSIINTLIKDMYASKDNE